MSELSLPFFIAIEIAVALFLICCFLIYHLGKLNKQISQLEAKASKAKNKAGSPESSDSKSGTVAAEKKSFLDHLDKYIDETTERHKALNPPRDITLDIAPDSTDDRHVCALRYAFLLAEKEAYYSAEGENAGWDVLQSKLLQIVELYQVASTADDSEDTEQLKTKLSELQQEMLNLKTRHIELEERYLELKK